MTQAGESALQNLNLNRLPLAFFLTLLLATTPSTAAPPHHGGDTPGSSHGNHSKSSYGNHSVSNHESGHESGHESNHGSSYGSSYGDDSEIPEAPGGKKGKQGKKGKNQEDDKGKDDEETWDVNQPPGEGYEVRLEVDEGTWMNLDVSPDGETLVFDLLGDLYTLPISGGEAKALTSGIAWDMQPRFSPDGQWIAFTSDRDGGDNIWTMKRDGSDAKAVTSESFRLLNNPAWSPDGQWIAARKHFTSRRSLGAGEIWLYHRSGGDGLQLNEKPNDQKDLGEPAFSPDGRYIYFSQDTTPGSFFEYNKDPNSEIYTVQRLDRETGEIEPFITGPGGAVRPTPSPDGKHIAFVRRVRYETALFLHDIDSGKNTLLTKGLERDMQETWAVHGVYANMAWTPDSASIVYWAGGKLHRYFLADGKHEEIPFRVSTTRELREALRTPVEVAPETFHTKMLRWVQVSPQGDRAVFQTLGHLWVRDLPAGEPRRLTGQQDHYEFYPSFSRDGQQIVYTTWHDEDQGTVRVVSSDGGTGRIITSRPGHYVEPTFSPDGGTVVYRKTSGGFLTSPLYARNPGLYAVPTAGGDAVRVAGQGFAPHFGKDADRVYYLDFVEDGNRVLNSILLDPHADTERTVSTHLKSTAATEFRVSPTGDWVAFRERFNVFVAPFVAASKTVDVGPKTSSIPMQKVSKEAGEYLHWSGAGDALYWSLGAELFRRELNQSFTFLEGAPEELPEPTAEGIDLGFEVETDVPEGTVAFVGGRLITMKGDEVIENGTVVVKGNRITAVGPSDEVEIPAGAHRVDITGQTLLPGLVDVHWHGSQGTSEMTPQQNWFNFSSLAFGVTTIHDPSNDTSTFFAASELARAGAITAPRLYSTGTILYGASGDFKAEIDGLEDAFFHLRRMKAVGAISVKSYNQPRRDQRQQVIEAARKLNMMVVPEGGSLFMHNMTMIIDGHTGIEHALPVAHVYDDVVQMWSESRTGYTPTLVVGYGGLWGENYWYQVTNVWENERLMTFTPRFAVDPRSRRRVMVPENEINHIDLARTCKQLADAGVLVQVGAHGQREGLGAHWELWMFEQGGMTPHEALRVATLNGAKYIGLDGDIGSIETGKLADLIVLDKNPLENIRHSESIRYTMINGRLYDAKTMNQLGNHPEERKTFFFEEDSLIESP